jgi:class 3 adenylate cyclase
MESLPNVHRSLEPEFPLKDFMCRLRLAECTGKLDKSNVSQSLATSGGGTNFLVHTVMFCDIAGFTAWSSVREPSQVSAQTSQFSVLRRIL